MASADFHDQLEHLAFIAKLPPELRESVADIFEHIAELRSVPKDGVWLRENEPTENKGYILLAGSVAVTRTGSPETVVRAPELLGEMIQFNPHRLRNATVTALEDIALARFFWDDFWKEVETRLTGEQMQEIRNAMESVAWEHLTG